MVQYILYDDCILENIDETLVTNSIGTIEQDLILLRYYKGQFNSMG